MQRDKSQTIRALLQWAVNRIASDSARLDAELLLCHVLKCPRVYLITHADDIIDAMPVEKFQQHVQARQQGMPIAYLLGEKEFWSLTFKVNQNCLIPRPETELIIETLDQILDKNKPLNIIDLGTGSGAIAITLATLSTAWQLFATDQAWQTLEVAQLNVAKLLQRSIFLIQSDWLQCVAKQAFDVIVANPPYIDANDPHLHVLQHEPQSALIAQDKGLADLKTIIIQSYHCLKAKGLIMLEHGYEQGQEVRTLLAQAGFQKIQTKKDYAGNERLSYAYKK